MCEKITACKPCPEVMQLDHLDKTLDSSSQEGKNLWFCPPDGVLWRYHIRDLYAVYAVCAVYQ